MWPLPPPRARARPPTRVRMASWPVSSVSSVRGTCRACAATTETDTEGRSCSSARTAPSSPAPSKQMNDTVTTNLSFLESSRPLYSLNRIGGEHPRSLASEPSQIHVDKMERRVDMRNQGKTNCLIFLLLGGVLWWLLGNWLCWLFSSVRWASLHLFGSCQVSIHHACGSRTHCGSWGGSQRPALSTLSLPHQIQEQYDRPHRPAQG